MTMLNSARALCCWKIATITKPPSFASGKQLHAKNHPFSFDIEKTLRWDDPLVYI